MSTIIYTFAGFAWFALGIAGWIVGQDGFYIQIVFGTIFLELANINRRLNK